MARTEFRLASFSLRRTVAMVVTVSVHIIALVYVTLPTVAERNTRKEFDRAMKAVLHPVTLNASDKSSTPVSRTTRRLFPEQAPRSTKSSPPRAAAPVASNSGSVMRPHIFNADGSIAIPTNRPSFEGKDSDVVRMRPSNFVPCRRTRFEQAWVRGQNENAGAEVARKYLRYIGLYNPVVEAHYQERESRHASECSPSGGPP